MIRLTFIPKTREYAAYFTNEIEFGGDITKEYTCEVIDSNLPKPKIVKFITKVVENIPVNFVVLEFEGRCSSTQMTVLFKTATEMVEAKKVAFLTWIAGYFTWLNFLFKALSLKTLKKITIGFATVIIGVGAAGVGYAVIDWGYEAIYDEPLDDSVFIEYVDNVRFRVIGKWIRNEGVEKAGEFKEFVKDTAVDTFDTVKEKAEDAKDAVVDKIEDIKD